MGRFFYHNYCSGGYLFAGPAISQHKVSQPFVRYFGTAVYFSAGVGRAYFILFKWFYL